MTVRTVKVTIEAESVWENREYGYRVAIICGANLYSEEYSPAIVARTILQPGEEQGDSVVLAIDVVDFVADFAEYKAPTGNVIPIR